MSLLASFFEPKKSTNKSDACIVSKGTCRVIDAPRLPSPDRIYSPNLLHPLPCQL